MWRHRHPRRPHHRHPRRRCRLAGSAAFMTPARWVQMLASPGRLPRAMLLGGATTSASKPGMRSGRSLCTASSSKSRGLDTKRTSLRRPCAVCWASMLAIAPRCSRTLLLHPLPLHPTSLRAPRPPQPSCHKEGGRPFSWRNLHRASRGRRLRTCSRR